MYVLYMFMSVVIQEQFCFGGEITDEVISFESLPVNITRKGPACNQASVTLSLSFGTNFSESNGHYIRPHSSILATALLCLLSTAFNENCTFQPSQLNKVCIISLRGMNKLFENDTVPGVVTVVQNSISFCNETDKNVTIQKCEWSCRYFLHCQDALHLCAPINQCIYYLIYGIYLSHKSYGEDIRVWLKVKWVAGASATWMHCIHLIPWPVLFACIYVTIYLSLVHYIFNLNSSYLQFHSDVHYVSVTFKYILHLQTFYVNGVKRNMG